MVAGRLRLQEKNILHSASCKCNSVQGTNSATGTHAAKEIAIVPTVTMQPLVLQQPEVRKGYYTYPAHLITHVLITHILALPAKLAGLPDVV